jgi:hypothetical protein
MLLMMLITIWVDVLVLQKKVKNEKNATMNAGKTTTNKWILPDLGQLSSFVQKHAKKPTSKICTVNRALTSP